MIPAELAAPFYARLSGDSGEHRALLKSLLLEAVPDDGRVFSGPTARLAFWFDRDNLSATLQKALRRILHGRISQNAARAALARAIYLLTDVDPPAGLLDPELFPEETARDPAGPFSFYVVSVQVTTAGATCTITALNEDGETVELLCADRTPSYLAPNERNAGRCFHRLGAMVKPRQLLRVFNATETEPGRFACADDTLVIVEPDFLVNITDLAECFFSVGGRMTGNPRLFLLKLFQPVETSRAILRGKLVNEAFDYILRESVEPDDGVYDRFLAANSLVSARMTDTDLDALVSEVRVQYLPAILRFAADRKHVPCFLEPSFLAPDFGLQGRLDALFEDPDDPLRKNVVELKSGSPPNGPRVWDNHLAQTTGYNLLLRSIYGPERRGDSAIFYPRAAIHPLRNAYEAASVEQRLLMLRNEIVRTLADWADGRFETLDKLRPESFGPRPVFVGDTLETFAKVMHNLDPRSRAWAEFHISAVLTEMFRAKIGDLGGFARLWRESPAEKRPGFDIMEGLTLLSVDGLRAAFSRSRNETSNFREGDIAVLVPENDDPLRGRPLLRGAIEKMLPDRITVRFWGIPGDLLTRHSSWRAEHDLFDRGWLSQLQSIFRLCAAPVERRELLLGIRPPEPIPDTDLEIPGLSPAQAGVVRRCLAAIDLHLVLGPPGTGKTSLVMSRIVACRRMSHPDEIIVVLAFTNRAVEEIASRLPEGEFLRLGRESEHSLRAHAKTESRAELRARVLSTRLVIGTAASFVERIADLAGLFRFDTVIVDEASQLLESQVIGILSAFRRAILIGDHRQLPPVTTLDNFRETPEILREIGFDGAAESLFERLFRRYRDQGWNWGLDTLDEHYRMHGEIAGAVNHAYDGRLRTALDRQREPLADDIPELPAGARLVFVPSPPELRDTPCHQTEAEAVAQLLNAYRAIWPDHPGKIGVITPFRAQISLIRSLLPDDPWFAAVVIDTVERFQGSERDVILFSAAVNRPAHLRRMVSERYGVDRKLNVAISRARERFVLLGDPRVLNASPHYRELIEHSIAGANPAAT
jgi:DNA replication ATP-dependent helicase Dna2